MNEFTAKKLGEVLAFAVVGQEIFEKGKDALAQVLTVEGVAEAAKSMEGHAQAIKSLAEIRGTGEVTIPKSQKTGDKLRAMLDLYVGDEWDNPAELLEWLGFFEGAAIVHWKLVEGAGTALNDIKLQELAASGVKFHQNLLLTVSERIRDLGGKKAAS